MKKILLILVVLALASCNDDKVVLDKAEYEKLLNIPQPEYPKAISVPNNNLKRYELYKLQIVVIDSCEYILGSTNDYHGGLVLTHKGNCKFCKIRENEN